MFRKLDAYQGLVPLLLRIGVGLTFVFAGLGKVLGGVGGVAGFFGSLGVPLPGLMAPFISYLELLGGLAILLGLFTRPLGLLMVGNMLVAMVLVSIPGWLGFERGLVAGFAETRVEFMLLLASACLIFTGAGPFSLDALLFGDRGTPAPARNDARVRPAR